MVVNTGARWVGRLALLLLLLLAGWAAAAAPARADEPAKPLTKEERLKLGAKAQELNERAVRLSDQGKFVEAADLAEQALALFRRVFPAEQYPNGCPELAAVLSNVGTLHKAAGDNAKAEPCYREGLAMCRKLYPASKYRDGHADLALAVRDLATVLEAEGKYDEAGRFYRETLDMRRKLYPAADYPDGHPDVAQSLDELGELFMHQGEYGKAKPYLRDALAMWRKLRPADQYPDGDIRVAISLNNLGTLHRDRGEYRDAESYYRDALTMCRKLYPKAQYPDGSPELAQAINNLGTLLKREERYAETEAVNREALAMRRKLYPAADYPDGHPALVESLNELGSVLLAQGEYGKAEPLLREALAMCRKLYPDAHPDLAESLSNVGAVLKEQGEFEKAEPFLRDALAMYRELYPKAQYPDGNPDLAEGLNNLAAVLAAQKKFDKAETLVREALTMYRKLFPDGHPELAGTVNNLGSLLSNQGKYDKAAPLVREAVGMYRKLYPPRQYPNGHADLAGGLQDLGVVLIRQKEYGKAADALAESLSLYDGLTRVFTDAGAEAEALNFVASLPPARNLYLGATSRLADADPDDHYPVLWRGKAALGRAQARRRLLLAAAAAAAASAADAAKVRALLQVRQDLARLILAPAQPADADRGQLLQELTDKKESLEKELARLLPASEDDARPYTDLAKRLPDRAAFLDLYRYESWDPKAPAESDARYAVFVLRKGRPVRRVELADAAAVEKDLAEWRQDIAKGLRSEAAGRLRRAVWEPIAKALGDGVDTVYVCPDGELSALPWPALPGDKDGRVLLEDYAFAVVPSGPFLLEQLSRPAAADAGPGVLLAVGGVRFDRDGKVGKPWPALPATDKERAGVVAQVRKLPKPPEVVERSGPDADVARLVKDLPNARWAHLATHGFFAAADSKERERLFRPGDFQMGAGRERRGAAARNPLTLSGLVLAGANQPTADDGGVLSAETVASMNLDGLDLAVLSACQTGLGEAATGEGVFGLQRAFHTGGAKNVVASLWTVDDDATAALMNLFYYYLWEKSEAPLDALRHAQLDLYRSPASIPALARGRGGADWEEVVEKAGKPPVGPKRPAAVKDWAAFVLSGVGR